MFNKSFKVICAASFVYFLTCAPTCLLTLPLRVINFSPPAACAAVPNAINYQGRYREYGQPVTGTRWMQFCVYGNIADPTQPPPVGNTPVWSSAPQAVSLSTGGIYNVVLNPAFDLRTPNLYLVLFVAPGAGNTSNYKPLLPMEPINSNWYSLHALSAEGISASAGQNVGFIIGTSTPMVITSNGYVGIGVSTPAYSLEVSSSIKLDSGVLIFSDGSSMATAGLASVGAVSGNNNVPITAGLSGSGDIQFNTGTNEQMVIKYSGKVGVGTVTPDQALSVIGNIDQTGVIISSGTGNNYFAGNVGIGTTNPTAVLDVAPGVPLSGNGNGIILQAQAGATSGNTTGGNVSISAGNAGNGNANGGSLTYSAGAGLGTGAGGGISLAAGNAATGVTAAYGGQITISAGYGYTGGSVTICSGYGATGPAGNISMIVGTASTPALTLSSSALVVNGRIQDETGFVMPVGTILPYGGSTAPKGWLLCNGQSCSSALYPDLYNAIGTAFGGNSTNFLVPNLQGMFLRGAGTNNAYQTANGTYYAGGSVGTEMTDLMQGHYQQFNDPGHNHNITDPGHAHSFAFYTNDTTANVNSDNSILNSGAYKFGTYNWTSGSSTTGIGIKIAYTGCSIGSPTNDGTNGVPRTGDETRPASISVNYIIKY